MSEHLSVLESAISDLGRWTWWTANLPKVVQVEFSATQIWNPPTAEGQPPSSLIALRFGKPRRICFLTFSESVPDDWPEQLQRDELEPPTVSYEAFTLTESKLYAEIIGRAVAVRALVGEPGDSPLPKAGEVFIAFEAGSYGMIVIAESLAVFNHHEELDSEAVLAGVRKWWEYWREYWRRKDSQDPMPKDYACEVTIPMAQNE